jgi:hypothetical protein
MCLLERSVLLDKMAIMLPAIQNWLSSFYLRLNAFHSTPLTMNSEPPYMSAKLQNRVYFRNKFESQNTSFQLWTFNHIPRTLESLQVSP